MNNCNSIFYSILTFIIMSCINLDSFWHVSCSFLLLVWHRLLAASVKTLDCSLGHTLQVAKHGQMRAYKEERPNERVETKYGQLSHQIKSHQIYLQQQLPPDCGSATSVDEFSTERKGLTDKINRER